MTTDEANSLDAGEWGDFVTRAVREIRGEVGEAAANRVATSLLDLRAEAMAAADVQLHAIRAQRDFAEAEATEARRSHERLQADLACMKVAQRDAKADAARIRSDAARLFAQRNAAADALAEAETRRIAEAWEEVRAQETAVATRRSELLTMGESVDRRLADVEQAERELEVLRRSVEADRTEAQRVVGDAIEKLDAVEMERAEERAVVDEVAPADGVLDLRDEAIDLRASALDEREAELVEWEAELKIKTEEVDRRATALSLVAPLPADNPSGWGRRTRSAR